MFLEIFRSFKVFGLILWLILGQNLGQNSQNSNNWTKIAILGHKIVNICQILFLLPFLSIKGFWWFLGNFSFLGPFYGYFCVFQKRWQNWKNVLKFWKSNIRIILVLWWKFGLVLTVFAHFRAVLVIFRFLISRYREIPDFWDTSLTT